jgi:hypothetical protein
MDETNSLGDYENNLSFEDQQVDVNSVQNDLIAQMNQLSLNGDVVLGQCKNLFKVELLYHLYFKYHIFVCKVNQN